MNSNVSRPGRLELSGKVAVVTGASRGIGASIATYLAAKGASVVVNYVRGREAAEDVVAEIVNQGGRAIAIQADLTVQADIVRLFAETKEALQGLDVLVNNAGNYDFAPLGEITAEHCQKQYNLNVFGLLFTTQEAVKYFGDHGGSIVNISSLASSFAGPGAAVYAGTKAAVDAMTKVFSKELGARNIRVNAVNPGVIEVCDPATMAEKDRRELLAQTPLGRTGQPSDVAKAVAFFASEESAWITGEVMIVSGGMR